MQNVSLEYGGLETYRDGFGCLWRNNHQRVVYAHYACRDEDKSGIALVWGVHEQQCKEIIIQVTPSTLVLTRMF